MNATTKQIIISYVFSKIPHSIFDKLLQNNLIIPYYHMISDKDTVHIKHLYRYKDIKQFKADLNYILKYYRPIGLIDLIGLIKNGHSLKRKSFLLTFDDGFREMHDIVAPILLKMGVPATFFVSSAFIDNKQLSYDHKASIIAEKYQGLLTSELNSKIGEILNNERIASKDIQSAILSIKYKNKHLLDEIAKLMNIDFKSYLLRYKPYLTSSKIKKLLNYGFTIGAHSIDHPPYNSLPVSDQLYQTIQSVKKIRNHFSLDYGAFAFPHTSYKITNQFFNEVSASGLVDICFGTGGLTENFNSHVIQRFSLEKPFLSADKIISLVFARTLYKAIRGHTKSCAEKTER